MSTRREFLSFIPAIWCPVIDARAEQEAHIDRLVNELVAALEKDTGKKWVCKRDAGLLMMKKL